MVHSLANPDDVEAFLKDTLGKRIEALEAAVNSMLIGVNHIALYRTEKWPEVGTDHENALRILGATRDYDMWCCWNEAMLVSAALRDGE
jgi:hypothetical protein